MQKRAKGHKYQNTYESNKHNGNREKTQTKEEAPWFLSKAGSPKGKMQPQEEGFGETQRKHLCQSGSANKRKRALVRPEGSTYAGAEVFIGIHGECLEHLMYLVAITKEKVS